ncbi:hypothetical protein CNR22_21140 [Sphingobacteriaceae bacterium]|nr:hypothetical protein CNR22_21140 [Sphingobacteriaceae bacterium]
MKKNLTHLMMGFGIIGSAMAQTIVTGPSSSQTPYLQPLAAGSTITSIFTTSSSVGGYTMCGTPDGLGAYDNNDGTFTLLMNHEFGSTAGVARAHGQPGAFISKWVINKSTLAVVSGADLMQNINLWTGTTYTTYNAANTSTLAAFGRFCSADLPAVSAYYNAASGKGTQERIFMNGEESGTEGRALAHIATGPNAGNTYELPHLGKASFENQVACPYSSDKTIVVGLDDATPGQVYVYIGTKSSTGNEITKAGLVGGKLYGVAVLGLLNEVSTGFPNAGTTFNLIDLGNVSNQTGATLNTNSNNVGVTNFLRPEDGAWDPSNPRDFYFATTNAFASPSRVWRLRFTDINNPELGGTITTVLDGTEGQKMLDNITIDHYGNMMLVEDVGNNAHNGKVWNYKLATDNFSLFAQHDTTRFMTGGANFLTIDEEASGILDAQDVLGAGMFLIVDQAHYAQPGALVEGGQLMTLYNSAAALSNPEINVQGNAVNIPTGNTAVTANDNTNFGSVNLGSSVQKAFVIQNAGPGVLYINSLSFSGANAGDFTFVNSPVSTTIAANASKTIYAQYSPVVLGTSNAKIIINNNDFNESGYSYAIQGSGVAPEINLTGNNVNIVSGNTAINANDNTDFGSVIYNTAVTKEFSIQNTGTGTLNLTGMSINGNNAAMFTFVNPSTFPVTLAANATKQFTVQYLSTSVGTHTASIAVNSSDSDESIYTFMVEGKSLQDVGIKSLSKSENFVSLYPNPAKDEATLRFNLDDNAHVAVTVFDIQGKVVINSLEKDLEKGQREITLNTSSLKNGEYFVKLNNGSKSASVKLVVIH